MRASWRSQTIILVAACMRVGGGIGLETIYKLFEN